ncbi:peptidoglycan recognition protein family protein [Streptomyces sp. INA 01156]
MAPPMSASAFLSALKAEGLKVVEVGDWRDHNRNHKGPWGPVHGVMIHHTATRGSAGPSSCAARATRACRGRCATASSPRTAGSTSSATAGPTTRPGRRRRAARRDRGEGAPADNEQNTDGNRHFYGFECENLGDGDDPWPAVQLEAIERAAAAVCRRHGWNERSVIGHLEWQPGKVDPRGFTMASMRTRIRDRLK